MKSSIRRVRLALSKFPLVLRSSGTQDSALIRDDDTNKIVERTGFPIRVLIPGRLAFIFAERSEVLDLKRKARGPGESHFITTDLHHQYNPFAADFGPVNLGVVVRFCRLLLKQLQSVDGMLVYCIERNPQAAANACFLLGSFLVAACGIGPFEASQLFMYSSSHCRLLPFRDATELPHDYDLTLHDCLAGLSKAIHADWFDLKSFNLEDYEKLDDPSLGDIHQICPKFVAFKGPLSVESKRREEGELAFPPEHFVPIFHKMDVSCVVRLNDKDTYPKNVFEDSGIRHYDLFFDDCTIPSEAIVAKFLSLCSTERKLAVHCRAGLGRTGTLIATWMMKHAGFGASEAIAWLRIVRPGSVIGPQQHYLKACEDAARGRPVPPPASLSGAFSAAELGQLMTAAMHHREQVKAAGCRRTTAATIAEDASTAAWSQSSSATSNVKLGRRSPGTARQLPGIGASLHSSSSVAPTSGCTGSNLKTATSQWRGSSGFNLRSDESFERDK